MTRLRAIRGKIQVDQIAREVTRQLAFIRDSGVAISHVDSHGHLHKFKPFREALQRVLPHFGIERVRTVQDIYPQRALLSPTFWLGFLWRRQIRRTFRTTDHLAMPMCDESPDWREKLISLIKPGRTLEVGVHPGTNDASRNTQRIGVQQLARFLRDRGVRLISWNDL